MSLVRAMMDLSPNDAIAVFDRDFRLIAANALWMTSTGQDDSAIGKPLGELFGHLAEIAVKEMEPVLHGRHIIRTSNLSDGGALGEIAMTPWRDEAGEIVGIVSRFAIAQLGQSMENRQRRLRLAMDMANVYAFQIDFQTGETTYEPEQPQMETKRLHSYEDTLRLLPRSQQEPLYATWARHLETGEPLVTEYQSASATGELKWHRSVCEAIRDTDNEVVGLVGITQMIDAQKRAELALLGEKEAAQAADKSKSEFLANISHEIRTPLNGVLGLSSLLARTRLDATQAEMVSTIEASARTLNVLLTDVLDLAKIEAGRLELDAEPFDPADMVRYIHNLFAGAATEKGLVFACDIDASIHGLMIGDRTRLSQILTNLTSNAIKFTAAGQVSLRAWAEGEGENQTLSVAVTDTGQGISGEALSRLFERFVQADGSISRSFGGTGLGLAISRTLSRMMGGDVAVTSELGHGSTFTVTVRAPFWDQDVGETASEDSAIAALPDDRPIRVLLVEDHPVNRRVVELILDGLVSLETAENGALGLKAFRARPFDVVLMDMQMPVMDGLEATLAIRAHERKTGAAPTPVIMLTANALGDHVRRCLEAGANFHLAKPITADGLVQAVARAVDHGADAAEPATKVSQ